MTGKTHQILGLATGLTTYFSQTTIEYDPATFGAALTFSFLGSLLPDIDTEAAEIWHYLPFGKTAGRIVDPFLEHRNLTHSLLGFMLVGVGMFFLLQSFPDYWGINTFLVFICFMLAYFSHLLADMFTVEGIPLLFPVGKFYGLPPKPFHGFRIKTGKWFENLIIFPLINIWLILIIIFYFPYIKIILFKE